MIDRASHGDMRHFAVPPLQCRPFERMNRLLPSLNTQSSLYLAMSKLGYTVPLGHMIKFSRYL